MTSCNHHPTFKLKMLFARTTVYMCKNCGADLEMTVQTKNISKIINALTIGVLVYLALNSNFSKTQSGTNSTLLYFAAMAGIVVAYLALQALLMTFGKFDEIESGQTISVTPITTDASDTANSSGTSDTSDTSGTSDTADAGSDRQSGVDSTATKSQYTQEQLDLMALYESYAKLDREENGKNPGNTDMPAVEAPVPVEDTCEHVPAKNWKNYVPGVYDFKCDKCGKVITFPVARKKNLNLILLAFSSVILIASFSTQNIPFWGLGLMAAGVVIICSFVQYFFVKNSVFEIKK